MFIGKLSASYSFFHCGTDLPFPPSIEEDGIREWNWNVLFDAGLDMEAKLDAPAYVGSVRLTLTEGSEMPYVQVLVDGKPVGILDSRDGVGLTGAVTIPVGVVADKLTVRLGTNLKKVGFAEPEILGCRDDHTPFLYPTVANMVMGEGAPVRLGQLIADENCADATFAKNHLISRMDERFVDWQAEDGAAVTLAIDKSFPGERYCVKVTEAGVTLTAGDRLPLLYAVETLLSACDNGSFPLCDITDEPYKPMRGIHVGLPRREDMDFARRLVRYVMLPLRYNQLFVEFCGGMRFHRHPEISEAWLEGNRLAAEGKQPPFPHSGMGAGGQCLEQDEVRALFDYIHDYGFEVIPEVQSLGHVQYITYAHPEIAEREEKTNEVLDTRAEDARPSEFYAHCYCPSMQESYDIIFDIIDEIVDVCRPQRFVHIGHDEVYQIGVCPRCQGQDPAVLFTRHVTALHDHIAAMGLRTMMWSDQLHDVAGKKKKPADAIAMLPRDIIMLDFTWYFHFDLDLEEDLLAHGYDVLMGNLYSSHYPRYSKRIAHPQMLGGQVSIWTRFNEYNIAKNGKFWDFMYTAEMLWNPQYDEGQRTTYTHLLTKRIQPQLRDDMRGFSRLVPSKVTEVALPKADQSRIPAEVLALAPNAIPADNVTLEINAQCRRMVFGQTALWVVPRIAFQVLAPVGKYILTYADGGTKELEVEHHGNVLSWNQSYGKPMPQQYYRHQGYVGTWNMEPIAQSKDYNGRDTMISGFVWDNPEPDRKIASVQYVPNENEASKLVLTGVTVIE